MKIFLVQNREVLFVSGLAVLNMSNLVGFSNPRAGIAFGIWSTVCLAAAFAGMVMENKK